MIMMLLSFLLVLVSASCKDPSDLEAPGFFNTSIRFYSPDFNENQIFQPNVSNKYFDPSKPTLLYIPGWAPGYRVKKYKFSFSFRQSYPQKAASMYGGTPIEEQVWHEKGWNVAMFDYLAYADDLPEFLEGKIYYNKRWGRMKWRDEEGIHWNPCQEIPSLSTILFNYASLIPTGNELRIVGLSLGASLALATGELIAPSRTLLRIVLLEPIFFKIGYRKNGKRPDELGYKSGLIIKEHGGALEFYKSSRMTSLFNGIVSSANYPLRKISAFVRLRPLYIKSDTFTFNGLMYQHVIPLDYYLRSISFPSLVQGGATSFDKIREYMESGMYWDQVNGLEAGNDVEKYDFNRVGSKLEWRTGA